MLILLMLVSELFSAPLAVCFPYDTLFQKEDYRQQARHMRHRIDSSKHLSQYSSRASVNGLTDARTSGKHKAFSIVIPLTCVLFVLLVLLVLKVSYLKQRRLQSIHELPVLLNAFQKDQDDLEIMHGHSLCHTQDIAALDMRSICSRFSRQVSRRSSISSNAETFPCNRQCPDSAPGFLVGFLGSPDWETNMQRELANHQWRLRRESQNLSLKSQQRHTWHSQQSYSHSRNSTIRSRPQSSFNNHSTLLRPARHSSLRISHASSFRAMYTDTFRNKGPRPKSFNAVVDRLSASHSGSTQGHSPMSFLHPSSSRATNATGVSSYSMPPVLLGQRPSTIREVDTPRSPPGNEGTFHLQVIDYGDGTPVMTNSSTSPALEQSARQKGSLDGGLGSANMVLSSTYGHLNGSGESSVGGSWRHLPQFPSPPASPISPALITPQMPDGVQVNTVRIEPCYVDDQFYDGAKALPSEPFDAGYDLGLLGKNKRESASRQNLDSFSPLTVDFRWPTLSDLLISELLHLGSSLVKNTSQQSVKSMKPPSVVTPDLSSASPALQETLTPPRIANNIQSRFLSPQSATVLNRHHSRVRDHVPFSLITPPKAYLRSPRSFEHTVRFSSDRETVEGEGRVPAALPHAASLTELTSPVRPSPLRRVASMGSVGSSGASSRAVGNTSNDSKDSSTISDGIVGCSRVSLNSGTASIYPKADGFHDVTEGPATNTHRLNPRASHASLFLDLGGSSLVYEDESSDFYSFDAGDGLDMLYYLEYPQGSSSEILAVMDGRSDNEN